MTLKSQIESIVLLTSKKNTGNHHHSLISQTPQLGSIIVPSPDLRFFAKCPLCSSSAIVFFVSCRFPSIQHNYKNSYNYKCKLKNAKEYRQNNLHNTLLSVKFLI